MIIKKIKTNIKLQIPAGNATPAPPIGPILGQHGVNIIEFCKDFNNKSNSLEKGLIVPVIITIYIDRSFTFNIKTSPASELLKKEINITSGSDKPNINKIGKINLNQIKKIAILKSEDLTGKNLEMKIKTIIGTAKSMGIIIE